MASIPNLKSAATVNLSVTNQSASRKPQAASRKPQIAPSAPQQSIWARRCGIGPRNVRRASRLNRLRPAPDEACAAECTAAWRQRDLLAARFGRIDAVFRGSARLLAKPPRQKRKTATRAVFPKTKPVVRSGHRRGGDLALPAPANEAHPAQAADHQWKGRGDRHRVAAVVKPDPVEARASLLTIQERDEYPTVS